MIKRYYREMIIVGLVVALLASFKSCDNVNSTPQAALSHRIVHDTILKIVPSPTVVRWEKKLVPVVTRQYDTVYSFDTDTLINVVNETPYLYADIPVQEYKDSSYYIRTIGWLDSVVIISTHPSPSLLKKGCDHWLMGQYSPDSYGVGYGITGRRWMDGVMYDIRNRSYGVTVGWKLNRPKVLINKK